MAGDKSFRAWLRQQRHRDDPVGDVARDERDGAVLSRSSEWRKVALAWHAAGAVDVCMNALERAYAEYSSTVPRPWYDVVFDEPPHPERARRSALPPRLRASVLERDGFRCRRCGAGPADERLVVDHVMPVALGGSDEPWNLQTLCEPCNQGKGDRPPQPHDLRAL